MGNHIRTSVRRSGAGLAGLALLSAVMAGCSSTSSDASGAPGSPSTVTETVTSSPTSSPSSSPTSKASESSPGESPSSESSEATGSEDSSAGSDTVPLCGTPDLGAAIAPAPGGGTAGATYYELSLTNRSDHTCRMKGWAGVSYVAGSDGDQVGAAADRTGADQRRYVTLIPNARAVEDVAVTSAGKYPASKCQPTQARGFRIYPPDNRESLFVAQSARACAASGAHLLSVAPVHAVS